MLTAAEVAAKEAQRQFEEITLSSHNVYKKTFVNDRGTRSSPMCGDSVVNSSRRETAFICVS